MLAICAYEYGEVLEHPAECGFLQNDPEMANIINFHLGCFNSNDFDTRIDAFDRLLTACNGSSNYNGFKRHLEVIVGNLNLLENQGRCSCAELRYQEKTVADKCVDADRVEQ